MDLHRRIAHILKEQQMTQRELARRTGYVESTVSKWINGSLIPSIDALMTLCEILDVSSDWLLWGDSKATTISIATGIPQWEIVDTTFSMTSCSFNELIVSAQSLFFTSVWLPRAFDASAPALHRLIQSGCTMRFIFPELDITLKNFYNTNGKETSEESERKKLNILNSLYFIKQWRNNCPIELRLSPARPVNNVLIVDYHLSTSIVLYIPYLYGDFEMGIRPGFIIDQKKHPDWYAQFYQRYIINMWDNADIINDIDTLIERVKDYT